MKSSILGWESSVVAPEFIVNLIKPGMSIFLSTGVAEPRSVVRQLMQCRAANLTDLELVQLVSLGDAISLEALESQSFRLKTFFSGWAANNAIEEGRIDLIPSRFHKIPELISSGQIPIDMAVVQITPPDEHGYCSLGAAVDVAWEAMAKASLRVGEINPHIPRTFGDTFVPITEFEYLVLSRDPPIYCQRWQVDEVMDEVARHTAALIADGSCLAFSLGPLYEALGRYLQSKHHLGIHTPFFTDPLMDLMESGAVTNRQKESHRGKSLTSYAFGTPKLMNWLDNNPLVEFQSIDKVFNPLIIGNNPQVVTIVAGRRIDLCGRVGLHVGKGNVASGPSEIIDFFCGAELSTKGRSLFALPSRNLKGQPNIVPSIAHLHNQFSMFEAVGTVVTEYGTAYLAGRTVRERAQALIEVAHPDDRAGLLKEAKARKIIYPDQVFLSASARLYPLEISTARTFKDGLTVRFRAIKPSDEEGMRQLFYRMSEQTNYSRYLHHVRSMPHPKMQQYVNVDWNRDMSIVGLIGDDGKERVIAEGRYLLTAEDHYAELVFLVDERYQGYGIAAHLYTMLIRLAGERGVEGFVADVLASNVGMMKIFHRGELPVHATLDSGVYHLSIPLAAG